MAKIKVALDRPLYDGMVVTVKAPCECSAVDGLNVGGMNFSFRDAHGNDLTGIGNLFSKGAYVRFTLDIKNGYAFLQSADTNGYLENRIEVKQNKLAWATDEDIDAMFDGTYEGVENEDPEGDGYLPGENTVYFDVTDDGTVYLKPEYRGQPPKDTYEYAVSDNGVGVAGSKNGRLPKHLVIPDAVHGIAVTSIAPGAFYFNRMLESVVIPTAVTVIPEGCFSVAQNLRDIYAAQVTKIETWGLSDTRLKNVSFPNLNELGTDAFAACVNLETINVGNITTLPDNAFYSCFNLYRITGCANVSTIGVGACLYTPRLRYVDFVGENLTAVGAAAFLASGFVYDWSALTGCTFGAYATSAQTAGATDFWSGLTINECENPLPTHLCQHDERWAGRTVGTSGVTWKKSCILMAILHAYCGLKGLHLDTVDDFESIANAISPGILNNNKSNFSCVQTIATGLGLSVEVPNTGETKVTYNATSLQALYDALAAGKYVIVAVPGVGTAYVGTAYENYTTLGHVVLVYGVRADGKLIVADCLYDDAGDYSKATRYALPYEAFINATVIKDVYKMHSFYILSLDEQ